jgi:transposase
VSDRTHLAFVTGSSRTEPVMRMAPEAIEMVRVLYAVEKQAIDLPAAERLRLRQTQSAPVLVQLRQKLLTWKEQLLLKHPMAEAVNYALAR